MTAGVHLSLLGPLQLTVDGTTVAVSAARERALLARLAIDAGTAVSVDALVDELWGDDPPTSATTTLQTYASHLRRLVAPATIERVGAAYRLDGAEVDVDAFDQAIASAHRSPADRRSLLAKALGAWRGPPLADAGDGSAIVAARARLNAARLRAWESQAECDLAAGLHRDLVPDLESRCREHPLNEPFARLLATALYRCGRQADALAVLRRLRTNLVEELGLDPSSDVAVLEQAILQQDPALLLEVVELADGEARPTVPLPPRLGTGRFDTPLVGRRSEMIQLAATIEAAEAGESLPLQVVQGEAGIGKTRLAREVALLAAGREATVLWGRCQPELGGSLVPIAEALDHLVRHDPASAAGFEALLAALLPSLTSRGDPLLLLRIADEQRFALLDAVATVLQRRAADGPVMIVIDDVHWADVATLSVLDHLVSVQVPGLVVLATARVPEPSATEAWAGLVGRLERDGLATRVTLGGLGVPELRAMLDRATGGAASVGAVDSLARQTGGNPFFVREVLSLLGERAHQSLLGDDVTVPSGVGALLDQRLDHLGRDAETVLSAAAVLGPEFLPSEAAALAGLDEAAALDALASAAALGLVDELGANGRFGFAHALVQAAVRNRLGATREAALADRARQARAEQSGHHAGVLGHRVAGGLLAARTGAAETATATGALVDARLVTSRTILARIAAGARSAGVGDGAQPMAPLPIDNPRAGRTVLRLVPTLCRRGQRQTAVTRATECAAFARSVHDPGLFVEATLAAAAAADLVCGGLALLDGGVADLLAEALALQGDAAADPARRSWLMVHLAVADQEAGRRTPSVLRAEAAARLADQHVETQARAEALLVMRNAAWGPTDLSRRVAWVEEATALAMAVDHDARRPWLLARCLSARIEEHLRSADLAAAGESLARLRQLAEGASEPAIDRCTLLALASVSTANDDLASAASAVEQAARIDVGAEMSLRPDDALATVILTVATRSERLGDAADSIATASARWPDDLLWQGASAIADDEDVAATVLDRVQSGEWRRAPRTSTTMAGLALLTLAAARMGHPVATDLADDLSASDEQMVMVGRAGVLGPTTSFIERLRTAGREC